jgi:hypothetical protein
MQNWSMMPCVCTPTAPTPSDPIGLDVIVRVRFVSPSSREIYGVVVIHLMCCDLTRSAGAVRAGVLSEASVQ